MIFSPRGSYGKNRYDAMNALTFHEREEQQEVLHGVDKPIAEEDDFIANFPERSGCEPYEN